MSSLVVHGCVGVTAQSHGDHNLCMVKEAASE